MKLSSQSAISLLGLRNRYFLAVHNFLRDLHKTPQSSPSPRVRDTTDPREMVILVPHAVRLACLAGLCLPILLLPCWMWSPDRLLLLAVKSCGKNPPKTRRNSGNYLLSTFYLGLYGGGFAAVDSLDYLYKVYIGILVSGISWFSVLYRTWARNTTVLSMGLSPWGDFWFQLF